MHKVSKGEGVYGLAKKYNISASDIFAANEGADKGIKIDQVLLIPRNTASTSVSSSGNGSAGVVSTSTKTEKIYHTVTTGQTLSAIAKKYNTNIAQIKTLNNLKSDNINLGQKLVVGEKKIITSKPITKEEIVVKPTTPKEEIIAVKETPIAKDYKINEQVEPKVETVVEIDTKKIKELPRQQEPPQPVNTSYKVDDGDEVTEKGMADISSEGELSQDRSFILHPTAKIGTIMMITNPANNSAVFVRVVGTCKASNGIILKMNKSVAEKLGVNNNAEVTISYAK